MVTVDEMIDAFLEDETRLKMYRQAVALFEQCGIEEIVRRLAEPTSIPSENPARVQTAAFEHAESLGWYGAIEHLLNFEAAHRTTVQLKTQRQPEYGLREKLRGLGYSEEEIEKGLSVEEG